MVLVFGENEHDRMSLVQLMRALRTDCPKIETRRRPLVLIKNRDAAEQRKSAAAIADVVGADQRRFDVRLVVAHEDADALEPAHEALAERTERLLGEKGIRAVAATAAWETEAWWYLWPDAVLAVNSKWRHPNRQKTDVGKLRDAKEQLRRDLRPKQGRTRDYEESDSPEIARLVRERGIVDAHAATSNSFRRFAERFRAADLGPLR
ncbi:MAG: hypothetical protein KF729_22340 [Sandaracinaceae bacterium]|nr:hypothetical protein [Sandaracinaceae bacterium]